jgi:hypothetical protein
VDNSENTGTSLDELTQRLIESSKKTDSVNNNGIGGKLKFNSELLKTNLYQVRLLENISEALVRNDLLDMENQQESLQRENVRSAIFASLSKGMDTIVAYLKESTSARTRETLASILVSLIAVPTLIAGAVVQIVAELTNLLTKTFKGKGVLGKIFNLFFKFPVVLIGKILNSFTKDFPRLANVAKSISNFTKKAVDLFKNLGTNISQILDKSKGLAAVIIKAISTAFASSGDGFISDTKKIINKISEGISDLFKALFNIVRNAGGFKEIDKADGIFKKVIDKVVEIFKAIQKISVNIGKLIGKIFVPLKIIFGAIEFFKGAMEKAGEQSEMLPKVVAGIIGGIGGLFSSLVGGSLDLLKSLAGYLLGFLGAPGRAIKEWLKTFSFEKILKDMFNFLNDFVMMLIPGGESSELTKSLAAAIAGIASRISEFKDTMITFIKSEFDRLIKDPIISIFERIGGFFSGIKAFISTFMEAGVLNLLGDPKKVYEDAVSAFNNAKDGNVENSVVSTGADSKLKNTEDMANKSVEVDRRGRPVVINNNNNIVNKQGDQVSTNNTSISNSRRSRRGFGANTQRAYN